MNTLNKIAQQYTRKEFLSMSNEKRGDIFNGKNCPSSHGLDIINCGKLGINEHNCSKLCWEEAIKDIQFKDEIWVKCINDLGSKDLTLNKEYMVTSQGEIGIEVVNDSNKKYTYLVEAFEIIKDEKSKNFKEYTIQEVFQMAKGTILKLFPYDESEREIIVAEGIAENKYLYYIDNEGCHEEGVVVSSWLMEKPRFKVIKQPVSFTEVIDSKYKCKVEHELITDLLNSEITLKEFDNDELEYKWFLEYKNKGYLQLNLLMDVVMGFFNAREYKTVIKEGKWYLSEEEDIEASC